MILEYVLSEESKSNEAIAGYDLKTADYNDFTYGDMFTGDLILCDESTDFSQKFGWIPILDIGEELYRISNKIEVDNHCEYEFTANSNKIVFDKEGEDVLISTNYQNGVIRIGVEEYKLQAQKFLRGALADLLLLRPEAAVNPYVVSLKNEQN